MPADHEGLSPVLEEPSRCERGCVQAVEQELLTVSYGEEPHGPRLDEEPRLPGSTRRSKNHRGKNQQLERRSRCDQEWERDEVKAEKPTIHPSPSQHGQQHLHTSTTPNARHEPTPTQRTPALQLQLAPATAPERNPIPARSCQEWSPTNQARGAQRSIDVFQIDAPTHLVGASALPESRNSQREPQVTASVLVSTTPSTRRLGSGVRNGSMTDKQQSPATAVSCHSIMALAGKVERAV